LAELSNRLIPKPGIQTALHQALQLLLAHLVDEQLERELDERDVLRREGLLQAARQRSVDLPAYTQRIHARTCTRCVCTCTYKCTCMHMWTETRRERHTRAHTHARTARAPTRTHTSVWASESTHIPRLSVSACSTCSLAEREVGATAAAAVLSPPPPGAAAFGGGAEGAGTLSAERQPLSRSCVIKRR